MAGVADWLKITIVVHTSLLCDYDREQTFNQNDTRFVGGEAFAVEQAELHESASEMHENTRLHRMVAE